MNRYSRKSYSKRNVSRRNINNIYLNKTQKKYLKTHISKLIRENEKLKNKKRTIS